MYVQSMKYEESSDQTGRKRQGVEWATPNIYHPSHKTTKDETEEVKVTVADSVLNLTGETDKRNTQHSGKVVHRGK